MRSDRLGETLLPKRLALPVFASDALSSVAYAPDEIFLTLGLAGGALALTNSWKIALAVVVVMAVVTKRGSPRAFLLPQQALVDQRGDAGEDVERAVRA